MTSNQMGALCMVIAMSAYSINDALVKLVGVDLPLSQIMVMRGVLASVMLIALARIMGEQFLPKARRDWGFVLLRASCEVAATYFFLNALFVMPIANATAIMQAIPLTVTLAAALFLPERVGWRRVCAILVGFCGMLLIVQPGTDGFAEGTGFVLITVVLVTCRDIVTRYVPAGVPSMSMAVTTAVGVTLFGLVLSGSESWIPPTSTQTALLMGASIMILIGYLFAVLSMRAGDASFTAGFRYTGLLVALIAGLLLFDQWPDALTLLGALIVVGAGLFTLVRENQLGKRAKARN